MKKRMLFLVTFLFVVFSVGSLFADRDIDGSFIAFEPVWLAANPNYVPGATVAIPFILDNESPTSDPITSASLTFPTGVTVTSGTASGFGVDAYDFVGIYYDGSSNFEYLDYTGEFGNGATITYQANSIPNSINYYGPTPLYEAETTVVNTYGPGVEVTIDSGFTGPLVINWTLVSAGIGGPPNTISGTLIWGPPYGIDTFTITSTPNGTGGEWIVGDTLCLEVTTIDVANAVTVDLTPFGGPANFALIQDVVDDSLWANCYVIGTGSSDGTSYSITATASFTPGDDTETITGLAIDNILPNVSSWGYFYHVDRQDPPDDNGVADYNYGDIPIDNLDKDQVFYVIGDESTGDGIRWFVAASDQLAGDLDSDVQLNRRIELGTTNWDYWDPTIAVNDNAGNTVYGNAVNPDSLV
ncbi:MAG: hypothetical protein JW784_00875, partial [Candidatus Cloacimonetes bacterium]|nr:hypothetical protein [Candidatus Cloacimonadota bacterium]